MKYLLLLTLIFASLISVSQKLEDFCEGMDDNPAPTTGRNLILASDSIQIAFKVCKLLTPTGRVDTNDSYGNEQPHMIVRPSNAISVQKGDTISYQVYNSSCSIFIVAHADMTFTFKKPLYIPSAVFVTRYMEQEGLKSVTLGKTIYYFTEENNKVIRNRIRLSRVNL